MNTRVFALLVHMCLVLTRCHFIPISGGGIYHPSGEGLGVVSAVYSSSCVSYNSYNTTMKHAAAALTMAQQTCHDESVLAAHFGQPMPIVTHTLIGHDLPYRPMRGDWHRLAKMAAKRHSPCAGMQTARHHPLSLVNNVNNYVITYTLYINARLNYVNKIY